MIEEIDSTISDVARAANAAGGRAVLVGGYVRDRLLGRASKDYDVEIYGLAPDAAADLLSSFGELIQVGRAFGVLRVKGIDADFSLPRRDSKSGRGHRGFDVAFVAPAFGQGPFFLGFQHRIRPGFLEIARKAIFGND